MDATNLTQLSSREQLSALMDGALPADETRFLLRRLQHDASLAESWERWRLSAEVMRGLAPTQRLPTDFASRVAASLRGENGHAEVLLETAATSSRREVHAPAWLRWGGGVAVAASVAVVAFMIQPAALESPGNLQGNTVAAAVDAAPALVNNAIAVVKAPLSKAPAPQVPAQDPAGAGLESQTAALASAVAAIARPTRNNRRDNRSDNQPRVTLAPPIVASTPTLRVAAGGIAAAGNIAPLLPRSDIITRPWPRSVLPHTGGPGLTVGFGDSARSPEIYNPFQLRTGIDSMPPALLVDPHDAPAHDATTPASNQTDRAVNGEPQS